MTKRGEGLDLNAQIRDRIRGSSEVGVWTPSDFADLGQRNAVDKALSRMIASGEIRKVARGFYDIPRINSLTKRAAPPNPFKIIEAVSRRDGIPFIVDGITAANDLGFDTAVPARIVVHTTARLSPIPLGNSEITFKATTGQRLFWAGRPGMRLVQALDWLKDRYNRDQDEIDARVEKLLAENEDLAADLRDGFSTLSVWMQDVLRSHLFDKPAPTPEM